MDEPSGKRSKRGATTELNHDNWDQVITLTLLRKPIIGGTYIIRRPTFAGFRKMMSQKWPACLYRPIKKSFPRGSSRRQNDAELVTRE